MSACTLQPVHEHSVRSLNAPVWSANSVFGHRIHLFGQRTLCLVTECARLVRERSIQSPNAALVHRTLHSVSEHTRSVTKHSIRSVNAPVRSPNVLVRSANAAFGLLTRPFSQWTRPFSQQTQFTERTRSVTECSVRSPNAPVWSANTVFNSRTFSFSHIYTDQTNVFGDQTLYSRTKQVHLQTERCIRGPNGHVWWLTAIFTDRTGTFTNSLPGLKLNWMSLRTTAIQEWCLFECSVY